MPEVSKFSMRSVNIGGERWLWFVKVIISEVKNSTQFTPAPTPNLISGEHLGVNWEFLTTFFPLLSA